MARLRSNGIEIEYESRGEGPPVVLIMGVGAQLLFWDERFCEMLAARGFRVIRFDNRDTGLSTRLDGAGVPDIRRLIPRFLLGRPLEVPYTLDDMADDVDGLLGGLGLESAHVVGASLGGMVAQTLALRHPGRVRTLTSIMSAPGGRRALLGKPRAILSLLKPPARGRSEAIERHVALFRVIGSPGFPFDEQAHRDLAARAYDRSFYPPGMARQMAAVLASGSRRRALAAVRVPTLVIHGSEDPLIPVSGGRATARAIPGARFMLVDGMGHDLPQGVWPAVVSAIADMAEKYS